MSRVTLVLEDAESGQINFQACFEGGFNVESHAHQYGNLLISHMNELAAVLTPPTEEVIAKTAEGDTVVYTPEPIAAVLDGVAPVLTRW